MKLVNFISVLTCLNYAYLTVLLRFYCNKKFPLPRALSNYLNAMKLNFSRFPITLYHKVDFKVDSRHDSTECSSTTMLEEGGGDMKCNDCQNKTLQNHSKKLKKLF